MKDWTKYTSSHAECFYQKIYYIGDEKIGMNIVKYPTGCELSMQLPEELTKGRGTININVLSWGKTPKYKKAEAVMTGIIKDLCEEQK